MRITTESRMGTKVIMINMAFDYNIVSVDNISLHCKFLEQLHYFSYNKVVQSKID